MQKHVEQNKIEAAKAEKIIEQLAGKLIVLPNEEQGQVDTRVEEWIQDHIYIEIIN